MSAKGNGQNTWITNWYSGGATHHNKLPSNSKIPIRNTPPRAGRESEAQSGPEEDEHKDDVHARCADCV
jgi:hypothetical protein